MNIAAIKRTALASYDSRHKTYVVRSPLLDICLGEGRTETEAWSNFHALLSAMYIEYLEGRQVGEHKKRGRPRKDNKEFHLTVKPETREIVSELAHDLGTSQSAAVDYLAFFWKTSKPQKTRKTFGYSSSPLE